jgi:hypothetical protein
MRNYFVWEPLRPEGHESIAQALAWVIFLYCNRPHKALYRSAFLEKHPVRRVGGAEGAAENRVIPPCGIRSPFGPFSARLLAVRQR